MQALGRVPGRVRDARGVIQDLLMWKGGGEVVLVTLDCYGKANTVRPGHTNACQTTLMRVPSVLNTHTVPLVEADASRCASLWHHVTCGGK